MKLLKTTLLVGFIAGVSYLGYVGDVITKVEKTAPQIDTSGLAATMGSDLASAGTIVIDDSPAGISEVSVRLVQGEQEFSLFQETFPKGVARSTISLSKINLPKGVREGAASILISASDASFWKNTASTTKEIAFDLKSPTIAVVSQQHVATKGGAEFLLLEAIDSNLEKVQVSIGTLVFSAVPLEAFDSSFAGKNMYAALIAIPIDDEHQADILAQAFDTVGNMAKQSVSFRVKNFVRSKTSPAISASFVDRKVKPLFESFQQDSHEEIAKPEDNVSLFKTVNESYRQALQKKINGLQLSDNALPTKPFVKPMASATTSNFGEYRGYTLDGAEAGHSTHDGLDLASIKRDKVMATNDGTVAFSGFLGIYGNAVIIDHGMGLISLYGHLSSISVKEGQKVNQGELIAKSGETGLAGGDHLHFEFRIAGYPVMPKEWWDPHWVEDNVFGKIKTLKEEMQLVN